MSLVVFHVFWHSEPLGFYVYFDVDINSSFEFPVHYKWSVNSMKRAKVALNTLIISKQLNINKSNITPSIFMFQSYSSASLSVRVGYDIINYKYILTNHYKLKLLK